MTAILVHFSVYVCLLGVISSTSGEWVLLRGSNSSISLSVVVTGWLVGYFGFKGPLRQYFSLYQAVS